MESLGDKVKILISILNHKRGHLEDILRFTKLQTKALEDNNVRKLEDLIKSKQQRIDKIDRLDQKFSTLFVEIKKSSGVEDLKDLNVEKTLLIELKEATDKVRSTVIEIFNVEKINSLKSKVTMDKSKSDLKGVKKGKMVTAKYQVPSFGYEGRIINSKK